MLPAPSRPRWSRLAPPALALACLAIASCRRPNVDPRVTIEDSRDQAAATVRGVVKHQKTGEPIAAARLTLHCECLASPREATTDAAGSYAFANLPAGKYMLQVVYQRDVVRLRFDAQQGRRLEIHLVVDPERQPKS